MKKNVTILYIWNLLSVKKKVKKNVTVLYIWNLLSVDMCSHLNKW